MRLPISRLLLLLLAASLPVFADDLSAYRKLSLPVVELEFKKSWADEHRNLKPEEVRKLQDELTQIARAAFARVLSRGGRFEIVEAGGPGVLELHAVLRDFDLYAPEVSDSLLRRNYVFTAGEATLVAELRDAQAGTVLASLRDHREMRRYNDLQIATSITNAAETRDLVEDWARQLRRQIDHGHKIP
jgi:hypothetical protein